MNIKLVQAFVILAQQGNYRTAANSLCLTQPALTKQIQSLEHDVGLTLFRRGRQGAMLTVAGQQLYPRACELIQQHDDFRAYLKTVQQGNAGRLALGFGISSFQSAPAQVNAFRQCFPDVEITLNDMPSDVQCRLLLDGQLQAGFIRMPAPAGIKADIVIQEQLVLVTPATTGEKYTVSEMLAGAVALLQITPHRGAGLIAQTTQYLAANGLSPRVVIAADDIQTLLALIATGNGVALLPGGVKHMLPAGLKILPLAGPGAAWNVGIAWNPAIQDPLRDKFIDKVKNSQAVTITPHYNRTDT